MNEQQTDNCKVKYKSVGFFIEQAMHSRLISDYLYKNNQIGFYISSYEIIHILKIVSKR